MAANGRECEANRGELRTGGWGGIRADGERIGAD